MGKYGGLSGNYSYRTKERALKTLRSVKQAAKAEVAKGGAGYNISFTGERGFWTVSVTKKKRRK